ncbi:MAG: type II secretion system protein N [Curvibacter lanceolatus]|uniref:type II secretion system protein N n=1 Tax=Curvibacter lanceolatus TaxID=86182 RepID=UPI0003701804|nr:type II secretion system protein N [Curvibacter lanceolatus]MBV5295654.1 type II secretion system protein N [Curvibacter lanceolatus]
MRLRPPLTPTTARPRRAGAPARTPSPGRRWAWAGALCGALLSAVLGAPARWLADAVQQLSHDQVQLLLPRGTVWNGSAQLVLTGGSGSQDRSTLPGRLQWQLQPSLQGLGLSLSLPCCTEPTLQIRLSPNWGGATVQVQDHHSHWPAALLNGLGTPFNTLQVQGRLELASQGLQLQWIAGRAHLDGQLQIEARDVSSRLSTLKPMGSYHVTLQGGDSPTLQLNTLEGSLLLEGQGQWVGSRLRFEGAAQAAPEHEAALDNLLNIIGRRRGARSIITLGS